MQMQTKADRRQAIRDAYDVHHTCDREAGARAAAVAIAHARSARERRELGELREALDRVARAVCPGCRSGIPEGYTYCTRCQEARERRRLLGAQPE